MATSTRNDNNNVRIANGRQDIKPTSVKISVIGTLERSDDRSKRKKQLTLYQISVVVNKTELILNKQYRDFVRLHRILKHEFSDNLSYHTLRSLLSMKYVALSKQKTSSHRQATIEKYLQTIVSSKEIFNSHAVQSFLELLTDNTLALPDEMLLHIFKFVPRNVLLGLVCRRWLKIVTDKQYKQLLGDLPAIVRSEFITARAARKSVYMSPNQNPKEFGIKNRQAKDMRMAFSGLTDSDVMTVVSYCDKLEWLNISGNPLTGDALREIANHCTNLTSLELNFCQLLTEDSIQFLIKKLPKIKELHLAQCKNVTNATLKLLARHSELEVLSVSSIPMITDNGLIPIAQNCTQLRVLDMHRLDGVTGESFEVFAERCPYLTEIDISWSVKIDSESFLKLPQYCKFLKKVQLGGQHHPLPVLHQLVRECRYITQLELAYYGRGNDDDLRIIAASLPNLERINLQGWDQITIEGVQALFANCLMLKWINLAYCRNIRSQDLKRLKKKYPKSTF